MEKITSKIPNELYVIGTLTKQLYCSSSEEGTILLLQDTASPNRRQKVFKQGLFVCAGDLTFKNLPKLQWFIVFYISV